MKTLIISALIFLATSVVNSAQLYLKNGNQVSGDIKSQNEEEVILSIPDVGSVTFKMVEIEKIAENEYVPLDKIENKTRLITGTIEKTNQTSTSSSDSKAKAIEHYKIAMKHYSSGNYDLAIEHFNKAVAYESTFAGDPQYMVREKIDNARKNKAEAGKERTYSESGPQNLMEIKKDSKVRTIDNLPKRRSIPTKMDGTIDRDRLKK